jgi:ATP-dependent RNA helicase DDX27
VLDEADRLLELGFADELKEIVKSCPRGRQTMLFSATLTDTVQDLVNLSLNQPLRVSVNPFNSIVKGLTQEFIRVRDKSPIHREAIVLSLCRRTFKSQTIIFMPSKNQCHRLAIIFGLTNFKAAELHGNLTQAQRIEALDVFSKGEVDYLICTDIASRGLDISNVRTVINYSMPRMLSGYIHRVGRTARAGRTGCAVTLAGDDQRKELKEVLKRVQGVKSRQVPSKVLNKYKTIIASLSDDIKIIVEQERFDKTNRVAEMEANKATNLIEHEEEIFARPAKTWFQTPIERQAAKDRGDRLHTDAPEDPTKIKKETPKEKRQAEKDAKAKQKDKLAGLNRKKRRRAELLMESAEMKKEQRALADRGDEDAIKYMRTEGEMKRAGSVAKRAAKKLKADLDEVLPASRRQDEAPTKKSKKTNKSIEAMDGRRRNTYGGDEEGEGQNGTKRFDTGKHGMEHDPDPKKKKNENGKGKAAFKSESRYKRRK